MSRLPGAYNSVDPLTEAEMDDMDALFATDSEDDREFVPPPEEWGNSATEDDDDEDDFMVDEDVEEEIEIEEGGTGNAVVNDDDEEEVHRSGASTPNLQIAYDPSSRQILMVDAQGRGTRLTAADLQGSNLTLASLRRMLQARFGRSGLGFADDDEEEEDEWIGDEEEEDSDGGGPYWGRPVKRKEWYPVVTEPQPAGVQLERSGAFGPPPLKYSQRKFQTRSSQLGSLFHQRELGLSRASKADFGEFTVPNSAGTEVAQLRSKVYSGQYSEDGSFFYAAAQDQRVYIYDTSLAPQVGSKSVTDTLGARGRRGWDHRTSLKTKSIVKAEDHSFRWTITDATLSADNEWLVYSSITPRLHLARTRQGEEWGMEDHDQEILDLAPHGGGAGIWSVRFSNDGKEVVAGGSTGGSYFGQLYVYDIETRRTILRVKAHAHDVNAVAFADKSSPHLLLSGSDDSFVKIWDRRSLSGERASGVLVGHTEGITFVAPKGDGRYCISNGKDQAVKLWDLRMMMSDEKHERLRLDRLDFGIPGWDYRASTYPKPKYLEHPHDNSVMTYRGHAVLGTLIRCHFSPTSTTDQRYVYSGSADGRIHIWNLDGRVLSVLDRSQTRGLINSKTGEYNDPAEPEDPAKMKSRRSLRGLAVRDVSWHPSRPQIMSTAWGGHNGSEGSMALHQWKARVVGETLEDQVTRMEEESKG